MTLIPARRTVLTPIEAMHAIWQAHQDVMGGPCETTLLGILAAQSAFETARWKSCWNFNFGNISGGYHGASMLIHGAGEMVDGKSVERGTTDADGFRAYPDVISGARDFISFLGVASHPPKPNRYASAWAAAQSGDVTGFIAGLKAGGYFTDGEAHYRNSVNDVLSWIKRGPLPEFLASLTPVPEPA